jgi:threonine/homoserine/homoserine lactone efflux protein
MEHFGELLAAWITGAVAGFLVSMPIGPINITVINDGARHGFLHALLVGMGAVTMDMVYCGVGLAGFSNLFESRTIKAVMELVSFLLLLFLGWKYLRVKEVSVTSKAADRLELRLHPHTAYFTGLIRVIGNPGVLILWVTLSAAFVANDWVEPRGLDKALCVLGVGMGATTWFCLLSYGMSRGHGRFSSKTLLRLSHFSGGCLLTGAVLIAYRIVKLLAHN